MRHFLTNVVSQGFYQFINLVIPFVNVVVVARALGPTGVGQFQFISSVMQYFVLAVGLGLASYGIREIARVRDNPSEMSSRFCELETFNLITGACVVLVYVGVSLVMSDKLLFLIMGIALIGYLLDITWFFAGLERFVSITMATLVVRCIGLVCTVLFVRSPEDTVAYFVIQAVTVFLTLVVLWPAALRRVRFRLSSPRRAFAHLRPALSYYSVKVFISLYSTTTVTILGLLGSTSDVGHYSYAVLIPTTVASLVGSVDAVLLPHTSNWYAVGKADNARHTLNVTIHVQLFFTVPMVFAMLAIGPALVRTIFGPAFSQSGNLLRLVAIIALVIPLGGSIAKQYLMPKMEMRAFNISVIGSAALAVAISVATVPTIGAWGSALAIVCAECLVTVLRVVPLSKQGYLRFECGTIVRILVSSAIMCIVVLILGWLQIAPILRLTVQILSGALIYFGVTTLLGANTLLHAIHNLPSSRQTTLTPE